MIIKLYKDEGKSDKIVKVYDTPQKRKKNKANINEDDIFMPEIKMRE